MDGASQTLSESRPRSGSRYRRRPSGTTLETVTQARPRAALRTHRRKHKQCDLSSPPTRTLACPQPKSRSSTHLFIYFFLTASQADCAKHYISIGKLSCTWNKHTDTLYGSVPVAPDHTFSWIHELPMALPFLEWFVCVCVSTSMAHMEWYSFPTFHFHAALIYEVPPKVSN